MSEYVRYSLIKLFTEEQSAFYGNFRNIIN